MRIALRHVLPNISAYSETCAVLMFMTLSHRLFLATGEAKYIDVLERGMYNNALSGVSTTGNRFFYVNRLASAGDGRDERWERASLECCPPNLVRFLATMPGYIYAQDKRDAVYVNLYVTSRAAFKVARNDLSLAVESEMPWAGRSVVTVTSSEPTRASIKLRVPGWARNQPAPGSLYAYADALNKPNVIAVNGKPVSSGPDRFGYVTVDRVWRTGDSITIEFPMDARKVIADTRVKDDRAISASDIADYNLILFGDPGSNSVIAKVIGQLPIRWSKTQTASRAGACRWGSPLPQPAICCYSPLVAVCSTTQTLIGRSHSAIGSSLITRCHT
jgi:DUF1680 family protein